MVIQMTCVHFIDISNGLVTKYAELFALSLCEEYILNITYINMDMSQMTGCLGLMSSSYRVKPGSKNTQKHLFF